jgi:hypothetical protein
MTIKFKKGDLVEGIEDSPDGFAARAEWLGIVMDTETPQVWDRLDVFVQWHNGDRGWARPFSLKLVAEA